MKMGIVYSPLKYLNDHRLSIYSLKQKYLSILSLLILQITAHILQKTLKQKFTLLYLQEQANKQIVQVKTAKKHISNEGEALISQKMWIEMMGIWFFTGRVTRCMLLRIALSIILLIYYQTNMNFLQLLSSGASLFNFNLLNAVGNLGLTPSLEITTPKTLTPEQIIKEPNISNPTKAVNEGECDDGALQKEARVELFTKQQQLINQYMHLNIQLLSKKLENLEQIEKLPRQQQAEPQVEVKSGKKKIKKTNNCGHPEKEHYAKGMCSNCYHKYGRNKKPWNCPHDKLYANGMCQNCYINSYNRKRREERDEKPDSNDCHSELKEEQQS